MKLSEIKPGDIVEVDGGFDCMAAGRKKVHQTNGELWVECKQGTHMLEGQVDDDTGELVGVKWPGDPWPHEDKQR